LRALVREVYRYFPTFSILQRYADIRLRLRPSHGSGLIVVTLDRDVLRAPDVKVALLYRTSLRVALERH